MNHSEINASSPLHTTRQLLAARASTFKQIRNFFEQRSVLEVDTRLMDRYSVSDPYMRAFKVNNAAQLINLTEIAIGYLQTSPEYAMKRLLVKGSGDIYQLAKCFRAEEKSNHHDCEFTLLEWYRLDFTLTEMMSEVSQIINAILGEKTTHFISYREAFIGALDIDPFVISDAELESLCRHKLGDIPQDLLRDNYLSLLFSEVIEPSFSKQKITFVYHYPPSQASLAQVKDVDGLLVAERFEAYCGELELANGFHELSDADEQLQRFNADNQIREAMQLPAIEIDYRLIDALKRDLPDCCGVALGIDRLIMLKQKQKHIADILPLGEY